MISSRLAVKINAALINNIVGLPLTKSPLKVKRKAFSGKSFEIRQANKDRVILTIAQNAFGIHKNPVECKIEKYNYEESTNNISVIYTHRNSLKLTNTPGKVFVTGKINTIKKVGLKEKKYIKMISKKN